MILHSIISPYDIFYKWDRDEQYPQPVYRRVNGGIAEIENGRIRRLISTDPRMYLDRRYQPDTKFGRQ